MPANLTATAPSSWTRESRDRLLLALNNAKARPGHSGGVDLRSRTTATGYQESEQPEIGSRGWTDTQHSLPRRSQWCSLDKGGQTFLVFPPAGSGRFWAPDLAAKF